MPKKKLHEKYPLAGRCGLYCGACGAYRSQFDGETLKSIIAIKWDIPVEKLHCDGCGSASEGTLCYGCTFIKCLDEKGLSYCGECPEFEADTCEEFKKAADGYMEVYGVDIRKNMMLVREGKIKEWLSSAAESFKCKKCRGPLIAGEANCHHCEEPTDKKNDNKPVTVDD